MNYIVKYKTVFGTLKQINTTNQNLIKKLAESSMLVSVIKA